jgi:hypothetical protein
LTLHEETHPQRCSLARENYAHCFQSERDDLPKGGPDLMIGGIVAELPAMLTICTLILHVKGSVGLETAAKMTSIFVQEK